MLQVPTGSVRKSDMLPQGWSDGAGVYSLMYQHIDQSDDATYLLKIISVEGMLLVHLLASAKTFFCKYSSSNTVVQDFKLWNMLPHELEVVSVSSVGSFRRHLDNFWYNLN